MTTFKKKIGILAAALTLFASLFASSAPAFAADTFTPMEETLINLSGGFKFKGLSNKEMIAEVQVSTTAKKFKEIYYIVNLSKVTDTSFEPMDPGETFTYPYELGISNITWTSEHKGYSKAPVILDTDYTYVLSAVAELRFEDGTSQVHEFNTVWYPRNTEPSRKGKITEHNYGGINYNWLDNKYVTAEAYTTYRDYHDRYASLKSLYLRARLYEVNDDGTLTKKQEIADYTEDEFEIIGYSLGDFPADKKYKLYVETIKEEYVNGKNGVKLQYIYNNNVRTWTPVKTALQPKLPLRL
ncbi:hypothetical protein [Cohnella panacarvi]|uniref:hypothetical protein n=1 Tax=Cohnella panacarvi TaxID=400776 RepID=UPI00047C3E98|nr:hypothetical protein [Cohnella panacarvi]